MMIEFPRKLITVTTLSLALALGGCNTPGDSKPKPSPAMAPDPYAETQAMVERAKNLPSPQAEILLIDAANRLLDQGNLKEAKRLLKSIDTSTLPATVNADKIIALSQIALEQQHFDTAVELLTTDNYGVLTASTTLDAKRLNKLSLLRAAAWEAQENFLAAARERIFVSPMLETADLQLENHHQIWADLIQLPTDTLEQLTQTVAIPEIQGWLELAWIYKGQQDDLDQQLKAIHNWQQRFVGHPAAQQLPDSIRLLTETSEHKPQHIALLLPLQGKFRQSALAIQNGFLTAHYAATAKQTDPAKLPEVRIYDTTDIGSFNTVYQQAVRDGADIIVGPLQKENVHQLASSPQTLPVLTIALNTDDSTQETPENLYQFGLTPEVDAQEVALQAKHDHLKRAGIFFQQSPWGERAVSAFNEGWNDEESSVNFSTPFDTAQTLASTVKRMLLVDQSEARAQELKRILGRNIEFQPRRRQDIDFIYLVATPEQGRLIKPLLNFYFAENLPVYSGSQIYSGEFNPEKDRDLDGITFCDLPWMLETKDKMKKRLLGAWPKANPRFFRLNALGVDAYRLQTRIQLLRQVPGAGLFGSTGNLSVGNQNRIQRGLAWATFKNGQPVTLPKVVDATLMEEHAGQTNNREKTERESGGIPGARAPGATGI